MSVPQAISRERMRQAIAALPPRMQAAYRRHLFDRLDYSTIADELGIEVREVERLIAQSIVLIDLALAEEVGPQSPR